ncbi:hypothetical protein RclHR1_03060014 [Rhizophagus clarus]|uniref:Carbohydrate-binding module family 13 protein n=1 Tax=Rhizophagus clarus TaxID=94130 RepID=A0A2Z6R5Q3_9GLOM|nr:hypothetical protein RclHR1_03060014 [Rhizophagus clarus]GES79716.1 carbohydrate-binding module family 13 protein [Rhizophagus clarus]
MEVEQNVPALLQKEDTDIGITVGESPDVQIFPAHKLILNQFPYFKKLLSVQDSENNSIALPGISPKVFEVIYGYFYTRQLRLEKLKTKEIIKLLESVNELGCQDVVENLQKFLIERKSNWIENHLLYALEISNKHNFIKLQEFCNNYFRNHPELMFQLADFNTISERMLVLLIDRNNLLLDEAVVWDHVLKWGLHRHSHLSEDPKTWSEDEVNEVKNTLKNCLPLVRFSLLTSQQFYERAHRYIVRFDPELDDNLLKYYLVPGTENLYSPRQADIKESEIIKDSHTVSQILNQLSKIINNELSYRDYDYRSSYDLKLKLLLRGSRHGFTPKVFHDLCDNKPNTVTIIKVKGKDEILGGYNSGEWKSKNGYGNSKSFIFSLKSTSYGINVSPVEYNERALNYGINYGPSFGLSDLIISGQNFKYSGKCYCKMDDYKTHIRTTENTFSIEDYEVFQVIKK